ncbi:SapC family protein [Psychrosphaera haliotis]|uniref:Multidrug transporter n=1 Tax=Psychrosphaera haliotis TaxID=555083 RepID=A0A6N8FC19_9GAMM|nr:SapC family protein [Psychrosphaera haliotis]MUH73079.1 multidrug transporter [Psychrosphaera haliotis]
MATDFQPLHNETHKDVKLGKIKDVSDLKEQHALGLVVQEFTQACGEFPIVFLKDPKGDRYFPVAMMGVEQGTNVFVTEDGKWDATYMPARYTHKPLSVIPHKDDKNKFAIAIDMSSPLVSEEGEALFDSEGKESEHLESRKKSLMSYIEHEQVTVAYMKTLEDLDLIQPRNLKVNVKDKEYNLNGLYMVDEQKLHELSDDKYLELRKKGYIAAIYAQLSSLAQINKVLERQSKRVDVKAA